MYYLTYWEHLAYILDTRPVLQTPFFLDFERPLMLFLSYVWPFGHIVLAVTLLAYGLIIGNAYEPYKKYAGGNHDPDAIISGFLCASLALSIFLWAGTTGGTDYKNYLAAESTYGSAVPRVLPPRPNANRAFINVEQRHTTPVEAVHQAAMRARSSRFWIELTLPILVVFVVVFLLSLRYFFFALSYRRALSKPHLPTDIVDRALSGGRIDQHALANAFTQSTAPVVHDSLTDKVERERLAALAARLQTDTSALDNKLSKETEIARLVVSHARKRAELADMEKKLRDMGVKRNG